MSENKHYDFLGSIALIVISAAIILGSVQLYLKEGAPMYLSAGLMPLILGCALLFCSILFLIGSLKDGGIRARCAELKTWVHELATDKTVHSMIVGVIIMALYTYVLLSFLPFWLASLIFTIALMLYLKAATPVRIVLLSAGTVAFIVVLFQVMFRVPLP